MALIQNNSALKGVGATPVDNLLQPCALNLLVANTLVGKECGCVCVNV